jgi:hypothetical protein
MIYDLLRRLRRRAATFLQRLTAGDSVQFRLPLQSQEKTTTPEDVFSQYEMRMPSLQNAIDALPGWSSAFPESANVKAGTIPLFADTRILKALAAYGSIKGKQVLEVGPLEGMHTSILSEFGAAGIDAIEANRLCYLRCLVTKEILKLDRAAFFLGDIQFWLRERDKKYDFALASGVLYHMADPGEFLRLLSLRVKSIFIWTHYYDERVMPKSDVRHNPFTGRVELHSVSGMDVHYHERSYQQANTDASFCGGMRNQHYWLRKQEIVSLLKHLKYDDVIVLDDDPTHSGGPCFSILARQSSA